MKKITFSLLLAFAFLFTNNLFAQENLFSKGDKVLNLGIGLGSTLYTGSYYSSTIPPISASFELGFMDDVLEKGSIGLGGYAGFSAHKWKNTWAGADWGYKYTNIIVGARGTFHYPFIDKLDTYTGLMIGFNISSSKEFGNIDPNYNYSAASGGLVWSWYAGGRYYFTDKLAAMAEIGYGIAWLNIGVALKM
ncbi:MAG: hypothetical protein ACM3PT_01480 [Deltaproteobacteria bacterium]